MNIVIAGGKSKADFLIEALLKKKHKLIVLNSDEDYCEYLTQTHKIPIFFGEPTKIYNLEDAGVRGADIIIALMPRDSDNLAICQAGKRLFDVKRAVAIVTNPMNVEIFKKLGVNTAISATYYLANVVAEASTADNFLKGGLDEYVIGGQYEQL
ncbi:MAG: NAD-binding protein [Anaerovorax sp.]